MAELIELLISFIKIGFTSFGGASMVPLINAEMLSHHWMTTTEVADIVAIAEMTPGPLGTNCATFAGMRVAGVLGAIVANLGVVTPTLTLAVLAGFCLQKFRNSRLLEGALTGIRPASLGMVLTVIVTMSMQNYVSWQAVVIGAVWAGLLWGLKCGVPLVISVAALLGILLVR